MKEILISIRPQWVEKILNGEKTLEIRKSMPNCELPVKVYIYCTKHKSKKDELIFVEDPLNRVKPFYVFGNEYGHYFNQNGKVVAEFTLNNIDDFSVFENGSVQYWSAHNLEKSALTYEEVSKYVGLNKKGYAWHISDLKIYDKPRELGEFWVKRKCTTCFDTGYESSACVFDEDCMRPTPLTKAPQSWQYVKE